MIRGARYTAALALVVALFGVVGAAGAGCGQRECERRRAQHGGQHQASTGGDTPPDNGDVTPPPAEDASVAMNADAAVAEDAAVAVAPDGGMPAADDGAVAAADDASAGTSPEDEQRAKARRGRAAFTRACDTCHPGGDEDIGPRIIGKNFSVARMTKQIREGSGRMRPVPPTRLPESQMDNLMAYLQTIRAVRR